MPGHRERERMYLAIRRRRSRSDSPETRVMAYCQGLAFARPGRGTGKYLRSHAVAFPDRCVRFWPESGRLAAVERIDVAQVSRRTSLAILSRRWPCYSTLELTRPAATSPERHARW